jgi:hypothetical protein
MKKLINYMTLNGMNFIINSKFIKTKDDLFIEANNSNIKQAIITIQIFLSEGESDPLMTITKEFIPKGKFALLSNKIKIDKLTEKDVLKYIKELDHDHDFSHLK